jgi:hypothetical protein
MRLHLFAIVLALAGGAARADAPAACTDWGQRGALIHQDDFSAPSSGLPRGYVAEYVRKPGNVVENRDGRLLMDVDAGATVWLDKPLSGDILITYTRRVAVDGGKNDRLSDFNHFWMARDLHRASLFGRSGKLEEYDDLELYYVGFGGNTNSTTRFRRYGGGERMLLGEFKDKAHLLEPNRDYAIEIAVYKGCTRMRVDGQEWFSYRDPHPLTNGYFGLRTTWSRQTVDDLKIYQLK